MSDMPNPFAPFDVFFKSTTTVEHKKKLQKIKKLLSKKMAKRLFGKAFAQRSRAELQSAPEVAVPLSNQSALHSRYRGLKMPVKFKKPNVCVLRYSQKKWELRLRQMQKG
jgi:hypothetical protein